MKKVLLFFSALVLSVGFAFADDNDGWKTAVDFNWETGSTQAANTTVWHKVLLKGKVADGENVLLYMNNLESTAANVEVTAYTVITKTVAGKEYTSVNKLTGPESKSISANHNYALEIGGSVIKNFNLETVYIKLTTNRQIKFAAEPVEPGEKDTECMNAATLSIPGNLNYTNLNKNAWYHIDLAATKADNTKTLEVTIKNTGSTVAHLTAGISFDCPSTGLTEESTTLAAGATKTKKLDRKYLDMLAGDDIYLRINSDAKVTISAKEVANTEPVVYTDVTSPMDLDLDVTYTHNAGVTQWYAIDLKKMGKKLLPEVVVENKENASAHIDAIVVYETHASAYADRSFTLGANAIKVQEVERNVVNNAIAMTSAKQGVDTGIVYVRITSDKKIEFLARVKKRTEGTACAEAKLFDWTNGNKQSGNSTVWYAIAIKDAKAAGDKDIKLIIDNKSSKTANIDAKVAFECPFTTTTDGSRSVPANSQKSGTLKNSMYKHLSGDTIWVGLTTTQNIEFRAELVPAETGDLNYDCKNAKIFDPKGEGENVVISNGLDKDTVWFKFRISDVFDTEKDEVPQLHIVNKGTATANLRADVSLDCPCEIEALQGRSITVSKSAPYVNTPASDVLKSVSADSAWVRIIFDQPFQFWTEMVYENEGTTCATATEFNWTVGETYMPEDPHWYAVNIKKAKDEEKNIRLTIKNPTSKSAKVSADVSFECPVTSATHYEYTAAPGTQKSKVLTYSMFETVKADIVYVKIVSDQKLEISATLEDDLTPAIDFCDKAIGYDWVNGNDVYDTAGDTAWFYMAIDTFEKDNYALVPKVKIENLNPSTKANIKGIAAFKCHNVKSPMSRDMSIGAGKTYEKASERDMIKTYTDPSKKDTVWFGIVTDQDIHFEVEFYNPDQGQDCLHAVTFDWEKGNDQEDGTTVWYDIDISYIKKQKGKSARIGLHNLDGISGSEVAEMYFTCDDAEPFASYSYTLAANADKKYEMGREMFTNLKSDHILLKLFSAQDVHVYAELYDVETIPEITACEDATPVTYNVDIPQTDAEAWYVINLKDMRDRTTGDAKLTVTNIDAAEATILAELTYECPVTEKMQSRTITLGSGAKYEKEISRSLIDQTAADTVWMRITTDKAISFRVDLIDPRGSSCANPIEFDWVNGNLHAKDSTFWYHVSLDTIKNDAQERDMKLIIENIANPATANVTAELYFDCPTPSNPKGADRVQSYSFSDASKEKSITRAFLESAGWPLLMIKYTSDQTTRLRAELIDKLPKHKEIVNYYDTICAGSTAYRDSLNAKGHTLPILYKDTVIHDLVVDSIEYDYNNTERADSLIYHHVTVMKDPVLPKIDNLTATAALSLTAGTVLDLSTLTTEINDSITAGAGLTVNEVVSIAWEYENTAGVFVALPTTPYDVNAADVTIRYVATVQTCEQQNVVEGDRKIFTLNKCRYDVQTLDSVDCSGYTFVDRLNRSWTVDGNYTIVSDTLDHVFTPGVELGKSVQIYDYKVKAEPTKLAVTATPTASCGGGVDVTAATAELTTAYTPADKNTAGVNAIVWKYKDENGAYVDLLPLYPTEVKTIVVRYETTTECGTAIVGDDITVTVAADCQYGEETANDTVCAGTTVTLYGGDQVTVDADMVKQYPVKYIATDGRNADSLYIYNLYVYHALTVPETTALTEPVAICGEEVDASAAVSELQTTLNAAVAADDLAEPITSITWEVKDASGNWNPLATAPAITPAMTTVDVRYTVDAECNDVQKVFTIDVQKRSSENLGATYAKFTLVSYYGGRLLMVDQNTLEATYPDLTADKVEWYKVVNLYDVENPADEVTNPDTKLGTGWYYAPVDAEGKSIAAGAGQYYAKVVIDQSTSDPCGATVSCNQIVTITTTGAAPMLAPNMVAPNDQILLSGLNAEDSYTVSIYDLMGILVERFTVSGTESYTFQAQENAGYYMVGVEAGDMKHTLKYIVK